MPEVAANWASIDIEVPYRKLNTSKEGNSFPKYLFAWYLGHCSGNVIHKFKSPQSEKGQRIEICCLSRASCWALGWKETTTSNWDLYEILCLVTISERIHGAQAQEKQHSCFLTEVFTIFLEKGSCLQTLSSEKHAWGSGWGKGPVQMSIFLMEPELQEAMVSRGAVRPPPSSLYIKAFTGACLYSAFYRDFVIRPQVTTSIKTRHTWQYTTHKTRTTTGTWSMLR